MRGERPIVIRKAYRLARPFWSFPPRIDRDWPAILARIPLGYALEVPVSRGTVTAALTRLANKGMVKRYEYIANRTRNGQCIIYHVRVFLGEPFPIQATSRRFRYSSKYWDKVLGEVMSGRSVTVDAPYTVVYQAIYRRIRPRGRAPSCIRFEKIGKKGKEQVRLRSR